MAAASQASATTRPFRVGLLGGGVVGGGVYELIQRHLLCDSGGVAVTKICVRDISRPRDFTINSSTTLLTTNPEDLLNDPDIDCVVEVMGGAGAGSVASTFVNAALRKHKAVVTANKALLASELDSLNTLSMSTQTPLLFEAAVCGGIPIIHTLQTCYAGDRIQKVAGVCNGTTNYMLGKMEAGHDYHAALKEAQNLGYAEADPTADVEGHDVRAKICLLSKLAFGTTVSQDDVPCRGISQLTPSDFVHAARLNATIKLLGVAQSNAVNELPSSSQSVSVYVTPHVVSNSHVLASARGSGNVVLVESENMGLTSYVGPGAGRYPTANSVVADIARLATQFHAKSSGTDVRSPLTSSTAPFPLNTSLPIEPNYFHAGDWYVRLDEGISECTLQSAAEKHGVKVSGLQYLPGFVTLESNRHVAVQGFCQEVGSTMYMPIVQA
jgi:homoserine dehydrogenase